MIIATPEPDRVLELAQKREITAQLIGSVVAGKRITINMPSEELKSDEFEHFYL